MEISVYTLSTSCILGIRFTARDKSNKEVLLFDTDVHNDIKIR